MNSRACSIEQKLSALALTLAMLFFAGCTASIKAIKVAEPAPESESFIPSSIETGLPAVFEQSQGEVIPLITWSTGQEIVLPLISRLRETKLFSQVETRSPSVTTGEFVGLRLKIMEKLDRHDLNNLLNAMLMGGSLFLFSPFVEMKDDYESELRLEVRRWDGMTKQYIARSKGTVVYGVGDEWEPRKELAKRLRAGNINSLMNQLIRDANLYVKSQVAPPVVGKQSTPTISDANIALPMSVQNQHAYAIVIGIQNYRQSLPKAEYAVQDAESVKELLLKSLGYMEENVAVLLNEQATKGDFEKYVESWLPNRVEKDGTVLVYFSGHGSPNIKTSDAYLVPYDGDPAFVDKTGYPLKRLYEYLAKLPAKEVIVVLDSCFSGAGGRSVIAEGTRPMMLSIENPILTSGKTVVLAASSGSQVSSTYKEKGHGLLTYFVLKGLQGDADKNKDGTIDLTELFEYAKPQVERTARREFNNEQTPQLLGSPEILKRGIKLIERINP